MLNELRVKDPGEFGKVAVVMGGVAAEREISLNSGQAVFSALKQSAIDVIAIDVTGSIIDALGKHQFDRVFNIIHGRGGEDGVLQAVLETLNIPYTGSGVMASALSMDKQRTKLCWQGYGMSTPDWYLLKSEQEIDQCIEKLHFPVIVKPALEGSSIGMSRAENRQELVAAWKLASQYQCDVYAESWVVGKEYTVGVINNEALPVIRLQTPHEFYDYEAKYCTDTTQYHCPSGLQESEEKQLKNLAVEACSAIGVSGWARVDLFIDIDQQFQLIEVNTVPGMTDHSLVPMAAKAAGIDFNELVWRILETSIK